MEQAISTCYSTAALSEFQLLDWFGKLLCVTQINLEVLMMWRMLTRLPYARKGQTSLVLDMDGKMSSWLIISLASFSSYSFGLLMIGCLLFWMPVTSSLLSLR